MKSTMTTPKQNELLQVLRKEPSKKNVRVTKYLTDLEFKQQLFLQELEINVRQTASIKEKLDYLTKTLLIFQNACMLFEGSFELLLFPNDYTQLPNEKHQKITTYNKAHILIYKISITTIKEVIEFVKYAQEHKLLEQTIPQISKFMIHPKKCKIIDIVELGFALYHSDYFRNKSGDLPHLYEFIENLGNFFGIEILNVRQRISQLHERVKNPVVFLEKLTTIYLYNINLKMY